MHLYQNSGFDLEIKTMELKFWNVYKKPLNFTGTVNYLKILKRLKI